MKPADWSKKTIKYYFLVKNPEGHERTKYAETRFEAIAMCLEQDNNRFTPSQYTVRKATL